MPLKPAGVDPGRLQGHSRQIGIAGFAARFPDQAEGVSSGEGGEVPVSEGREGRFRRRMVGGRRPHVTKITHSDEEWARVQSLARAQGISVPRLYERALHVGDAQSAAKIARVVDEMHIIERVMSKTAVNINQIATVANATGEISAPQIGAAAAHLERQVARVVDLLEQLTGGDRFERCDDGYASSGEAVSS